MANQFHVVTGAFGYSGRWIAKELLLRGESVRTLTNAIGRDDPFDGHVEVHTIDFNDHQSMVGSLRGAHTLFNTYWVRYKGPNGEYGHTLAVENIRKLFAAAVEAKVRRIVHFSVAHPRKAPGWSYFCGKVEVEEMLTGSDLSFAIIRPTVFFGGQRDVLINNMAWLIRRFPVFGVFGMGNYPIQPVHISDVARIAVDQAFNEQNEIIDVAGPEKFQYKDYVKLIARSMGIRRIILPMPPMATWVVGKIVGAILRDRVITMAEIRGLMSGLMATDDEPLGFVRFTDWIQEHGEDIGKRYQNDLKERVYKKLDE